MMEGRSHLNERYKEEREREQNVQEESRAGRKKMLTEE